MSTTEFLLRFPRILLLSQNSLLSLLYMITLRAREVINHVSLVLAYRIHELQSDIRQQNLKITGKSYHLKKNYILHCARV